MKLKNLAFATILSSAIFHTNSQAAGLTIVESANGNIHVAAADFEYGVSLNGNSYSFPGYGRAELDTIVTNSADFVGAWVDNGFSSHGSGKIFFGENNTVSAELIYSVSPLGSGAATLTADFITSGLDPLNGRALVPFNTPANIPGTAYIFDAFQAAAVPEPAILINMLLGLPLLSAMIRRKQKA